MVSWSLILPDYISIKENEDEVSKAFTRTAAKINPDNRPLRIVLFSFPV